jgi:uncharacterized protein
MDDVEVRDEPGEGRYEVWAGGELAGFAVYRAGETAYSFVHTEIDPRFEGRGLASRLIRYALDDMAARGLSVLPHCPFVKAYIQKHPDPYLALVPAADRPRFALPRPGPGRDPQR